MTELDLTPHDPDVGSAGGGPRTLAGWPLRNVVIIGVLLVVMGFVLFQALTSARVFFLNVDEAVAQRSDLTGQTFQMQGTVVSEDGVDEVGALLFELAFGDERASVRHVGDEPSNLFALGEQVVVEGHWDGTVFQSHQILVKHSEEYVEENPDRVDYELPEGTVDEDTPGSDITDADDAGSPAEADTAADDGS